EKAYTVSQRIPASSAPQIVSTRASSLAAWPSVRGRPRRFAQRPLPSITTATWVGIRCGSRSLSSTPARYRTARAPQIARRSVPEALQGPGAGLPVLLHGDVQLQVGAGRELLPDPGADLLEDRAALADHDALLGLALDDDLDADPWPLPLDDPGRDRVGQLLPCDGEQLLADQFGDAHLLGDVGDLPLRVPAGPLRQAGDEVLDEGVDALAGAGRDREVLREVEL